MDWMGNGRLNRLRPFHALLLVLILGFCLSCHRDFESPYFPGSQSFVGDAWARDNDHDGVADSVNKYSPNCILSAKQCFDQALALSKLIGPTNSLSAKDMILWLGDAPVSPRLTWMPPEAENMGYSLTSSDSTKVRPHNGSLEAIAVGSALIWVKGNGNEVMSASFIATVLADGKRVVSISAQNLTLEVGQDLAPALTWTPIDATSKEYTLLSDKPEVARIVGQRILGVAPGTAMVTLETSDGNHRTTLVVTVFKLDIPVQSVTAASVISMTLGQANLVPTLSFKPANATDTIFTLTSKDVSVATIISGNTMVAMGIGRTEITVHVGATVTTVFTLAVIAKGDTLGVGSDLSGLSVSAGTLDTAFSKNDTEYVVSVPNEKLSTTVTVLCLNTKTTISLNALNLFSNVASGVITLKVGETLIPIVVVAENGVKKTYRILVRRSASANANLSNLVASAGIFTKAFFADSLNYELSVANTVTFTTITPTLSDSQRATVKVKDSATVSGKASQVLLLANGINIVPVVVTAENGDKKTYTVIVTRAAPGTVSANLSALTLSAGSLSPAFSASTLNYTMTVAYAINATTVVATALTPTTASITVNGIAVRSGSASNSIALNLGSNSISIVVLSDSGISGFTKAYQVTVIRSASVGSTDLSGLVLSAGAISPAFSAGTLEYTLTVPNGVANTTVTPTALTPSTSSITVNGTAVVSGAASGVVALAVGTNSILVVVTENGTNKSYNVIVTRTAATATSANLSALTLSAGSLSPAFSPSTLNYTLTVAYAIKTTTVMATALTPNTATITINGTVVSSGSASSSVPLSLGSNSISIVVLSDSGISGFTKAYQVTVIRSESVGSTDLSGLVLSAGAISPTFSGGSLDYTLTVPYVIATTTVMPTALTSSTSTITVNGTAVLSGSTSSVVALDVGANSILVVVKAETGITKTYSVMVTRLRAPFSKIDAGFYHTLFLRTDGTLWVTGENTVGQLGDGTTVNRLTPYQMMTGVAKVKGGYLYTLILKADGTLWATGHNSDGQLGDGTATNRFTPVQVMTGVTNMAAGLYHSLVLKADGTLWATGQNDYGELGDGTKVKRLTAIQIMTGVANVAAGHGFSLVLKTDGTLWATGHNSSGELGDGSNTDRSILFQIMTGVANMVAGYSSAFILKTDGTLWATGQNSSGELGDGTTTNRLTPYQMMTGVASMAAGGTHTLILKTDGTLWATGANSYGQFGNGTTTSQLTPVQISF